MSSEQTLGRLQDSEVLTGFLDLYEYPISANRDLEYARALVDFLKWPLRESVSLGGCATVALQFSDAAKAQWALTTAEIQHIAIGRRKLISREHLEAFIESHTRLGWQG